MNLHQTAVEAAVAAAGGVTPATGPLVELARSLSRQMDDAEPQPGSRLVASYLTTVRALVTQLGPAIDEQPKRGKLAQLRADMRLVETRAVS